MDFDQGLPQAPIYLYPSGQTDNTDANNIQTQLNRGRHIYLTPGTYTINTTLILCNSQDDNILEGDSAETVILQAGSGLTAPMIKTVSGSGLPRFRGVLKNLNLEMGTIAGNAITVNAGSQYFQFENLIIGGGTAASTMIDIEDSATFGTYYNSFRHVHERASAGFGSGLNIGTAAGAKSVGPNWFYGCTFVGNSGANAVKVGCGPNFFFGTELVQGNTYSNSTVQLLVTPTAANGFNPEVWFFGDFEITAGTTTGVQVDANAQLHAEGHFGMTIAQISAGGQVYMRSGRTGLSNSFVYNNWYSFSGDLLAQTTTAGSSNFLTYTPLNQQTFEAGGYLTLNSVSGGASPNIQLALNWTDQNNTGHTINLFGIQTGAGSGDASSAGTAGQTLMVKTVSIRIKANTAINFSVVVNGAPASINYDAGAWIRPATGN